MREGAKEASDLRPHGAIGLLPHVADAVAHRRVSGCVAGAVRALAVSASRIVGLAQLSHHAAQPEAVLEAGRRAGITRTWA